jgi:hypothetical protein
VLDVFLAQHPALRQISAGSVRGERRFLIELPLLQAERELRDAVLVVPTEFPVKKLEVYVSTKHVLRVPHVESGGRVCFAGDAGPGAGLTPEERVNDTLTSFIRDFVKPWAYGELDGDFSSEARNYWGLFVEGRSMKFNTVRAVYTTGLRPDAPRLLDALLVKPIGWVLVTFDAALSKRIVVSLGKRATQIVNAVVLQVPVATNLTPNTWPRTLADVTEQLNSHVPAEDVKRFFAGRKNKPIHHVVIFSSPNCDYAYLMPGGPPNVQKIQKSTFSLPVTDVVPLIVGRLDPSWTYGRDQHVEVSARQGKHVVVFGAGALGSYVIDQLAKAGVGRITVVDFDVMETANVGRHLLGVDAVGREKAICVTTQVGLANPACLLVPAKLTAQAWFKQTSRSRAPDVDLFVDVTGEPSVRAAIEEVRRTRPTKLLVAWMEPFVAAAHACQLTAEQLWLNGSVDRLEALEAVTWPPEVMRQEPACSSEFQAYTSAAAAHAVALAAEAAIELLDGSIETSRVKSWVRGERYLQAHVRNLALREWAAQAAPFDGLVLERAF